VASATHGTVVSVMAAIFGGPTTGGFVGTLVAEVDLARAAAWLAPIAGLIDDALVVDGLGRVIGRLAPTASTEPLLDLRSYAPVADALAGRATSTVARDVGDREGRFVATAPLRIAPALLGTGSFGSHWNWLTLTMRSPDVAASELETALTQVAALRTFVVLVL